jgi:integrase
MERSMTRSRFGTITRLGPDYYHLKWSENGRQRSKRIRGTRDDALAFLAQRQAEAGGTVPDMEWAVYWRSAVEPSLASLAEKTSHEYRRLWTRELEPRIGRKLVGDTTWRQVESVLNSIDSPTVQRAAFRLWRKICNMAVRDGMLDRNPVDRSIKLKPHRKRQKAVIEAADIGEWMEAIAGIKYEPILLLEVGGGLRHEEACAMVWENVTAHHAYGREYALVYVERGLVKVGGKKILKDTKNEHSRREVVIGEPFASRLLDLRRAAGPLCGTWSGGAYEARNFSSPETVTHNWRAWCERHGVEYVRPGDMRSVFATLHGEAGTPDSLVSLAMGHADGGSTKARNYQQRTRRGLIVAADSLTEYLREEAGNA